MILLGKDPPFFHGKTHEISKRAIEKPWRTVTVITGEGFFCVFLDRLSWESLYEPTNFFSVEKQMKFSERKTQPVFHDIILYHLALKNSEVGY
jgi:hypothetical protein